MEKTLCLDGPQNKIRQRIGKMNLNIPLTKPSATVFGTLFCVRFAIRRSYIVIAIKIVCVTARFETLSLACSRVACSSRSEIGERVKLYTGKTGEWGGGRGGGGGRDREFSPPFPLWSPLVFFLREFFSRALLSERLE